MTLAEALRAVGARGGDVVAARLRRLCAEATPAEARIRDVEALRRLVGDSYGDELADALTPRGARALHAAWLAAGPGRGRPPVGGGRKERVLVYLTAEEILRLDEARGEASRSEHLARGVR